MYSCTPAEAMCTIAWHTTTHDYSASAFSVANLALLLFRSVHVNVGFENPHTGLSQIRSGRRDRPSQDCRRTRRA